jgi:hypothetical protein
MRHNESSRAITQRRVVKRIKGPSKESRPAETRHKETVCGAAKMAKFLEKEAKRRRAEVDRRRTTWSNTT